MPGATIRVSSRAVSGLRRRAPIRSAAPPTALPLLGLLVLTASCGGRERSAADSADATDGRSATLALEELTSGTDVLLQAVSVVDERTVWISGHRATYVVTRDGGTTWAAATVPGDSTLQFRDVHAFGSDVAYLMSSGTGPQSRIYRTEDGGVSWRLQYTADDPAAFLDCMAFWSSERGLAYGDAVDGVPFLLVTEDGGDRWSRVSPDGLPAALEGEGGFAASGTCLVTGSDGVAWVATGNGARARVLRTSDHGATWTVVDVPVVAGSAAGLATITFLSDGRGVAMGGVIGNDTIRSRNVAVTSDGGATWAEGGRLAMAGPVYGAAVVPGGDGLMVAVGPRGIDWSDDLGRTWSSADTTTAWAVGFASPTAGWAAGPAGRIVRLAFTR